MYAYDELDRTLINERVDEFRDQVKRRLSGELTEDEFKMLRLQNGVYLQLHAYMFRVAIPYGTLSSKQLRALAHVARRYDRGYGHFTTLHPEFSFLPRKFKFAITASDHDRAAIKVHDIGLRLYKNEAGETGFEVLVGGGLGRTPFIGKTIKPFVHGHDLLSYIEAILRVYNQYGRRDNIYKARIKILVHELGIEKFAKEVEEEWQQMRDSALTLDDSVIEDVRSRFSYPAYEKLPHMPDELKQAAHDPLFERWRKNSVFPHKVQGYSIVTLSLKPVGGPPGDATADQMDTLADLADRFSFGEIRVGHEQNLALPHVARRDLPALWKALDRIGLATPNVNLVTDIIACPGLDYCSLANARSIPIAQELTRRFANHDTAEMIGRLHINISGCINACGHHHVGHIGILGVEKNGEEFYQITIGGRADENAQMGTLICPAVPSAEVADVIEDIVEAYLALRDRPEELFVDTVKRLGVEPFRERVYATRYERQDRRRSLCPGRRWRRA